VAVRCPKCHSDNTDTARFCSNCAMSLGAPPDHGPSLTKTLESPAQVAAPGTLVAGHYEVQEKLGQGGMGEVYRALDRNLGRQVAIKILPEEFSTDLERMARFEREAKLLATLNHPNIAAVYGFEEAKGLRFLVLELVQGETLQTRLDRGALPMDEALETCRQVAEGLEAAHERGVVHRDLKPGNIMITPEGKVKILDFGLAKAYAAETTGVDIEKSPTITAQMTEPGIILGTAAYMSPEQAKGKSVDKRTDIWAFGCILYECLTGGRAFVGETITETLAAILKGEPDWRALPASTPGITRFLLRQCLQRDPARRLRDITDARFQIAEGLAAEGEVAIPDQPARKASLQEKGPWALAALGFALAILALILWTPWKPPNQIRPYQMSSRLNIELPAEAPLVPPGFMPIGSGRPTMAFSPDGRYLAYVAWVGDHTQLYIRDMETAETKTVVGTEDARSPFFSPDSQWLGFSAGNKLNKISVGGGVPLPLADVASQDNGAAWGNDDQIYFNTNEMEGLYKVAASGGPAALVAAPLTGLGCTYPELLPNGEILVGSIDWSGIGIVNRSDPNAQRQLLSLTNCSYARYVPTGHLLYATPGKLMAILFDLKSMRTEGAPIVVLDDLRTEEEGAIQFAVSVDGTLVYARGEHVGVASFVWRDRHGNTTPVGLPKRHYGTFSLSHDGRKMAYIVNDMGWRDIYVYEFGGRETRFTYGGLNNCLIWSPDDTSIVFDVEKDGIYNSYQKALEGSKDAISLTQSKTNAVVHFFTPDRKQMLVGFSPYYQLVPALTPVGSTSSAASRIDMSQERNTFFFAIHPDGGYLSYTSTQYNRADIFVRTFPALDWRKQVSSNGGEEARWNPNGRELIYRWGSRWYVIDVKLQPKPDFAVPRELFHGPYINVPWYSWDISPDGERFLLLENPAYTKPATQLVVITNFLDELKRRLPAGK
jgi:serine/threonine protein kinase/Tol biopolymer transport system component